MIDVCELLAEVGVLSAGQDSDLPEMHLVTGSSRKVPEPVAYLHVSCSRPIPLYRHDVVVILGEPGTGKSTFVLHGLPEGSLLFSSDYGKEALEWLRAGWRLTQALYFVEASSPGHITGHLCRALQQGTLPPVVCIDTIQGVESDPERLDGLVRFLVRFARRTGVPVIVVSHENRRERVSRIQRIQGAPCLGEQATLILHISRGRRGERWIQVLKDRFNLFRWPGGSRLPCFKWTPRCAGSRTDGRVRSLSERERRVLRLLQENGPMAALEVARHLDISETHARRLLQGLARRGYVVIHPAPPGGGRGHKTRYSLKTRQDSPEAASGGGKRRKAAPDGVGGHVAGFSDCGGADSQVKPSKPAIGGAAGLSLTEKRIRQTHPPPIPPSMGNQEGEDPNVWATYKGVDSLSMSGVYMWSCPLNITHRLRVEICQGRLRGCAPTAVWAALEGQPRPLTHLRCDLCQDLLPCGCGSPWHGCFVPRDGRRLCRTCASPPRDPSQSWSAAH